MAGGDYDYTTDPEFLNAPAHQQHAYLMQNDAEYAAADPKMQSAYISHLNGGDKRAPDTPAVAPVPKPGALGDAPGQSTYPQTHPAGLQRVVGKAQQGDYSGAAHEAIGSMIDAVKGPALVAGTLTAPVSTGLALASGYAGQKVTHKGAEIMGANPSQADLAGDIGGLVGGTAGGMIPEAAGEVGPVGESIGRTLRDPGKQYEGKFPASTAVRRGPLKPGLNKIPVVGSLMDAITPGHPEPYDNAPAPPKTPAPLPSQGEVIHKLKPWANSTQEPSNPIPSRMPKSQQTGTGGFQAEPPSVGQKIKGGVGKSGLILPPDAPAPHVEGSYWSFNEGALRKAVMSGDRDAATVYKQRFGDLPPNAGLLTDVGAKPTRGLYRSQK